MLEEIETFENDSKQIKYFKSSNQIASNNLAISVNDLSVKWDSASYFAVCQYQRMKLI